MCSLRPQRCGARLPDQRSWCSPPIGAVTGAWAVLRTGVIRGGNAAWTGRRFFDTGGDTSTACGGLPAHALRGKAGFTTHAD